MTLLALLSLTVLAADSVPVTKPPVATGLVSSSTPSYSSGTFAMPWLDANGRLHIIDDTGSGAGSGGGSSTLSTAAKGTTAAGSPTSTAVDANTQGLDVSVKGTVPVSGTFWQATQPVSGTFWQSTQPVSGTFWQATQPVSSTQLPSALGAQATAGSLSVTLPSDQGTLTTKTSDVLSSGTITAASSFAVITAGSISSTVPTAGTFVSASISGIGSVGMSFTGGTTTGTFAFECSVDGTFFSPCNGVVPGTGTVATSTASVAGHWRFNGAGFRTIRVRAVTGATVTVAPTVTFTNSSAPGMVALAETLPAGTNSIGAVTMIAQKASNTATPGSALLMGAGAVDFGTAVISTAVAGNIQNLTIDTQGRLFVDTAHPRFFSCLVSAATATTQCQAAAAAGASLYITDVTLSNGGTAQTVQLVQGTGTACATGLANAGPVINLAVNAGQDHTFATPIKLTAAAALCCKPGGATAFSCWVSGYTAP
jgi:hypothetical protein